MAGVEAVWTTLWPVWPDSADLLGRDVVWAYWREGLPIAAAVQTAQRACLELAGDDRSDPREWAGWITFGRPDLLAGVPKTTEIPEIPKIEVPQTVIDVKPQLRRWVWWVMGLGSGLLLLAVVLWMFRRPLGLEEAKFPGAELVENEKSLKSFCV
jgi:hypothetical protein